MWKRDYRDIVAGAFFLLCGSSAAIYSSLSYRMGTFGSMGPGMFPALVGMAVAVFGASIMIPALFREGHLPQVDLRAAVAVLASTAAFATTAASFGLIAATFLLTGISMLASGRINPLAVLVLSSILSVAGYGIFSWGLGIPLQAWRWPF